MEPSPAPKQPSRRRRWWLWIALASLLLVIAAGVTIGLYPKWAGPWVQDKLSASLSRRLETTVTIEKLELDYQRVRLVGVTFDAPAIRLDEVFIDLEENPLWAWRADVSRVEVAGGYVESARQPLTAFARKLLKSAGEADEGQGGGFLRRRVGLRPEIVSVSDMAFDITDASGPVSRARGVIEAEGDPSAFDGEVTLHEVRAQVRALGDKSFRAKRVRTRIAMGPDGPSMPLRIDLVGGATAITNQIAVADVQGWVETADIKLSELKLELSGGFGAAQEQAAGEGAKLWSLTGSGKRDLSEGEIVVAMEPFELGRVPQVLERVPGLVDSQKATAGGELAVSLAEGKARLDGTVNLAGLNISHPLLARETVQDLDLQIDLAADVDPAAYRVDLEQLTVSRRGAQLQIKGSLVHTPERETRHYKVDMEVPTTDCSVVLGAIPRALVPSLTGLRVTGDYSAKVELDVDFAKLKELKLETKLRPRGCKVVGVPPALSTTRLRNGFTHRVTMRDGRHRMVRLFTGSGSYAGLSAISPSMVSAVLTTEDASFWRHSGFLPKQFGKALRRNLVAGRIRIGASTITMQMVKNVFLSHERTLSRKLQELVLTEYVERSLSKSRIMELYLNVIEFAPGVYGVRRASEHYFGKHPADLTSLESAYLALMLPSPVRRHSHFCKGELSASFDRKLRFIHRLMFERGHITEQEYLLWKDAPLLFDPLRSVSKGACLAEIQHLLDASEGQHAVSGLLAQPSGDRDDERQVRKQIEQEADDTKELKAAPTPLPDVDDMDDPANGDPAGAPAMDAVDGLG